jgi:hypothetical protein
VVDIIFEGLLPLVATCIHKVEAATGVFKSYARTTAISIVLGVVGVSAGKHELVGFLHQTDVDRRRSATADTMLESILDEGDKKQRGDFELIIDN